jgi:pyruvate/2-oxoglutarate dehydrogenase complex dihydrolipoamide acyltransferase (E2) component
VAKKMKKALKKLGKEVAELREQNERLVGLVEELQRSQDAAHGELRELLEERSGPAERESGSVTVDATGDLRPAEEPEATEAAERRAEELGVDLTDVEGTGAGGRATVRDVEEAASEDRDS